VQGTLLFPFTGGGVNWGGLAVEPTRRIAIANTMRLIHAITLIPRAGFQDARAADPDAEITPQMGTPFGMRRDLVTSPIGMPCNPPPWGALSAVDLESGTILWEVPLGTTEDMAPFGLDVADGVPNQGGPIVTAGGLVFIGAAMDDYIRAFDLATGRELWKGRLPAGGQATPMTYEVDGRQFVVIAAGGQARMGTRLGDSVVAFALPE
jgi:quinoprotein glucose dehydrogenase